MKDTENEIKEIFETKKIKIPDNYYIITNKPGVDEYINVSDEFEVNLDEELFESYYDFKMTGLENLDKYFNWPENMELFNYFMVNILKDKLTPWLLVQVSQSTQIIDNSGKYIYNSPNILFYINPVTLEQEITKPPVKDEKLKKKEKEEEEKPTRYVNLSEEPSKNEEFEEE